MLLGIDHLVLAVEDPDSAAATLETDLGLQAAGGGRHDSLGTFNRLIWLGDSYIELAGVFDRALAERNWFGRTMLEALARGGGLATWAIAVDGLDSQVRWIAGDVGFVGPLDGERRRADGRVVRWRLVHPPSPSPTIPFLIEHDVEGAEWTPTERAERAAEAHPVGGPVRLAALEIQTASPAAAAARLRSLLGTSAEPAGRSEVRVRVGVDVIRFVGARADAGPSRIVDLVADVPDATFRRRVSRIGESEIRVRRPQASAGPREPGAVRGD
jgi:hypothetical protein